MGTHQVMLRFIKRPTLEAMFQVMRVVNYGKGQKQWKKVVLRPKSTLTRPPIYDQSYVKKLTTASQDNPMDVRQPSLLLLFVQQDEKSLEESTSFEETYVLTTIGKNP